MCVCVRACACGNNTLKIVCVCVWRFLCVFVCVHVMCVHVYVCVCHRVQWLLITRERDTHRWREEMTNVVYKQFWNILQGWLILSPRILWILDDLRRLIVSQFFSYAIIVHIPIIILLVDQFFGVWSQHNTSSQEFSAHKTDLENHVWSTLFIFMRWTLTTAILHFYCCQLKLIQASDDGGGGIYISKTYCVFWSKSENHDKHLQVIVFFCMLADGGRV